MFPGKEMKWKDSVVLGPAVFLDLEFEMPEACSPLSESR